MVGLGPSFAMATLDIYTGFVLYSGTSSSIASTRTIVGVGHTSSSPIVTFDEGSSFVI